MNKNDIKVDIIPVGNLDLTQEPTYLLQHSQNCYAPELLNKAKWADTALKITWENESKSFKVDFKGLAEGTGINLMDYENISAFIKYVPIEIANKSNCLCGSTLELSEYTIETAGRDFIFKAEYFCPKCKLKAKAEKGGIMGILKKWVVGTKKIEIGLKGINVERE